MPKIIGQMLLRALVGTATGHFARDFLVFTQSGTIYDDI
jgi:hypothetical protein